MNFFQKTLISITKALTRDSLTNMLDASGNIVGQSYVDSNGDIVAQTSFKESLYIQSGLRIIKDTFSAVEFKLFKIINSKGEVEEVVAHPILDLLYKPNQLQTKLEYARLLALNFKLSGEVFIKLIPKESGEVEQMYIIPSKDVEVKFNEQTNALEYKVHLAQGKTVTYPAEEMVHVKDPDPVDMLRGYSALAPIMERALAEANALTYQRGIFASNGNPDSVIVFKSVTNADDLKKLKVSFFNSFKGKNDSMRAAVVGGEVDVKQMNNAGNVLDYKTSQEMVRDDIMMALGVPKALVTSDDVNRANADAALQQFMQFTIAPMFALILEALNERLVIPRYGEEYYLGTEKLVVEDKEMLLKESTQGVNKWLTANDIRLRYGYEPLEGSDTLKESAGFGNQAPQVIQNAFIGRRKLYLTLRAQESMARKAKVKVLDNPEFKKKYNKAVDSTRNKIEKRIKSKGREFMQEQYARILKQIDITGDDFSSAEQIFNKNEERKLTNNFIKPILNKSAEEAGNVALVPVKLLTSKSKAFSLGSGGHKEITDRAELFSTSITQTTYDALATIVAENISKGVKELKKALEDGFYETYIGRIDTIARTESCFITSLGTQIAYEESDVVSGKQWLTTGDGVVRPEHVQVDGDIVDVNSSFSNGESFPGEDSINCRCTIAPVVDISKL